MNKKLCLLSALLLFVASANVYADDRDDNSNNACPVGLVSGMDLNTEFGPGAAENTHCLARRHNVKLVVQINQFCAGSVVNGVCPRAYALENIQNIIDDYNITNGMKPGRDYEIAAIVHSGGGTLVVKNSALVAHGKGTNPFESQVRGLIAKGVKFYFCQNTVRGYIGNGILTAGNATSEVIDGVQYVTAGLTALADFQKTGWTYVQP